MNAVAVALTVPILAVPYFTEVTTPWTQACSGASTGCYTNYVAMADLDGDGSLDIVLPNANGYFSMGAAEPLVVLFNDSAGNFTDVSATAVGGFTGYLRQVAIGDIERDGDLDLYAPDAWGGDDAFFVNDGSGTFTNEAASRLDEQSRAGAARFGDVDGDGDLDLLIADWGADPFGAGATADAHLYLNDGSGVFAEAAASQTPDMSAPDGTTPIDIDFFDADGDFDLDVLLDAHEGNEILWLNDGAGTFTDVSASFPDGDNLSYGPVACDVDGDGDLDVAIDNGRGVLQEQLFINDGTGTFTDESAARLPGTQEDDNGLLCVDIDADADFDLLIPSLGSTERILENDGDGNFTVITNAFPAVADPTLGMDLGDVNGDGRLDAVTGQGEQPNNYEDRLYLGNADQPIDGVAPSFRAVQVDGNVPPGTSLKIRFGVQDSHVTDIGPRLARAWLVYSIDGTPFEVDADFVGGDLFQAQSGPMPAGGAGAYHVCATDRAGNSACSSPDLTFTIAPGDDDDDDDDDGRGGGGGGCGCHTTRSAGSNGTSALVLLVAAGIAAVSLRFGRSR